MQVQFFPSRLVVDIAERNQVAPGPFGERHVNAALAGDFYELLMGAAVKVGAHDFGLKVHHVDKPVAPSALIFPVAPESETFTEPALGQYLLGRADEFGEATARMENADEMTAASDPNVYFVIALEKLLITINVKQFRMERAMI